MGDPAREADRPYTAGMAAVERVKVEVVSIAPPRLRIDVSGFLPDACTEIERVDERRCPRGARLAPTVSPSGLPSPARSRSRSWATTISTSST